MNTVFKVVFNKTTGVYVAVCEYAKGQGKGAKTTLTHRKNINSTDLKRFKFRLLVTLVTFSLYGNNALAKVYVNNGVDNRCGGSNSNSNNPNSETFSNIGNNSSLCNSMDADSQTNRVLFWDENSTTNLSIGGDVYLNKSVKVKNGATVDMGNNKVTKVADGTDDDHAVNLSQLKSVKNLANRENYFHVNDGITSQPAGSATTNKGTIDAKGGATGTNSLAGGVNAQATNTNTIAIGSNVKANADYAIVIGADINTQNSNPTTSGKDSIAIGRQAVASGLNSVAIGGDGTSALAAIAEGTQSTAIGYDSHAKGEASFALGRDSNALSDYSASIGVDSKVENSEFGMALGDHSIVKDGERGIALGRYSYVRGSDSVAIGSNAKAGDSSHSNVSSAVAIGNGAHTNHKNSIAIGYKSEIIKTKGRDSIAIGNETQVNDATNSIALGKDAKIVGGSSAIAIGDGALAQKSDNRSIAIGKSAKVYSSDAVVLGNDSQIDAPAILNSGAESTHAIAIGRKAFIYQGKQSIAIGQDTNIGKAGQNKKTEQGIAIGNDADINENGASDVKQAIAIGVSSDADSSHSIAFGHDANVAASSDKGIAIGRQANVSGGQSSIAMGDGATASKTKAIAIGKGAKAEGEQSISIGTGNVVTGNKSGAIGDPSYLSGTGTYALGNDNGTSGAPISTNNTFILGSNVQTTANNSVFLGKDTAYVADDGARTQGLDNTYTSDNTVVTGKTLNFAGGNQVVGVVSVGSANQTRRIQNVAPGEISATSTDAINGSQLFSMANLLNIHYLSINSAGGSNYNNDGAKSDGSIAIGKDAIAGVTGTPAKTNATAVGTDSSALGNSSTAIGHSAKANGSQASAFGDDSKAVGNNSLAMGSVSRANAQGSTAIGSGATVRPNGESGTVVGVNASANMFDAVLGGGALSSGTTDANGYQTNSKGKNTALGYEAGKNLDGANNTVVGFQAGTNVNGDANIISGKRAGINTQGNANIIIGDQAGGGAISGAFGPSADVSMKGNQNIAVGKYSGTNAKGDDNILQGIGSGASVTGSNNVAIGYSAGTAVDLTNPATVIGSTQTFSNTVNIGYKTQALANSAVAIGDGAKTGVENAVAIGSNSSATTNAGIQGYDPFNLTSSTDKATATWTATKAAVSVGADTTTGGAFEQTRQITGVAAGKEDTDVVNVAQLKASQTHYYSINAGTAITPPATVSNNKNNDGAYGKNALAAGVSARAEGNQSVAIGYKATAEESDSFALGENSNSSGQNSLALGAESKTHSKYNVSLGRKTESKGTGAIAIGGGDGVAGDPNDFKGAQALKNGSIAIGGKGNSGNRGAQATESFAISLGSGSIAKKTASVAIGSSSVADTAAGVQGYDPLNRSTAPTGREWKSTLGAVSVGNGSNSRQITNVAAGSADTDAVNVAQLKAVQQDSDKKSYFHVNDGSNTGGNTTTNLAGVDKAGGATQTGALAAGIRTQAIGRNSTAVGSGAKARTSTATAIGAQANAHTTESTALGLRATAQGQQSTALGNDSLAYGYASMSNGGNRSGNNTTDVDKLKYSQPVTPGLTATTANADVTGNRRGVYITKFGNQYFRRNVAGGANSQAWGTHAQALGEGSVAMGLTATAGDADATFNSNRTDGIRTYTEKSGKHSVAIGSLSYAQKDYSIALGNESYSSNDGAVAIGNQSVAKADNAIAIGSDSVADRVASSGSTIATFGGYNPATNMVDGTNAGIENTRSNVAGVSVGRVTHKADGTVDTTVSTNKLRQITAVAAGTNDADAVNVAQLKASKTHYFSVNPNNSSRSLINNSDTSNKNNDTATGNLSLAAGYKARASGDRSSAIGSESLASGKRTTATGRLARAKKDDSSAYGYWSEASSVRSTAIGAKSRANTQDGSVALGYSSVASIGSGAIGYDATGTNHSADTSGVWKSTSGAVSVGDVNGTNKITRQITSVAAGTQDTDAVNVAQLKAVQTNLTNSGFKINADNNAEDTVALGETVKYVGDTKTVKTTVSNNQVKFEAITSTITNNATTGEATATTQTALATAGSVATAINGSGFTATSSANGGVNTGGSNELINPGDKLEFVAGKDITIAQQGGKFTFSTNNQAIAQSAQLPVVYTKADGTRLYKVGGNFYDNTAGTGTAFTGTVIASMNNGGNSSTSPMLLTNLQSTLPTPNATNQSAPSFANTAPNQLNNAATVGDVMNSGWNLTVNGNNVDFVTPYNTVNFINGTATTATVTSNGNVSIVKYDVKYDDDVFKLNTDGELTLKDSTVAVTNGSNTASGTNGSSTVTGGGVGGNLTVDAGKNLNADLSTSGSGANITNTIKLSTADNVEFTEVNVDSKLSVDNGATIDAGNNKIQNVANGTAPNDAVNYSQLQGVSGNSTTNTQNITNNTNNIAANAGNIASNSAGIANNSRDINKGINVSTNDDSMNKQLGGTIEIKGTLPNKTAASSNNVRTKINDKGAVEVMIAQTPKFKGLDSGNQKITGVAAGELPTDAVNVAQLQKLGYELTDNMNDLEDKANAGIAGSTAMAFLQHSNRPGKNSLSFGVGGYKNQKAIAVGYAINSDNNKWRMKAGASYNTQNEVNWGGSVGIQW